MKITIVQQNLDGFHNRCDIKNLMKELLGKSRGKRPDVLMLSEFCYSKHKDTVIKELKNDYDIIYPKGYRILYGENLILNGEHSDLSKEKLIKKLLADERILDDEYLLKKLLYYNGLIDMDKELLKKLGCIKMFDNEKLTPDEEEMLKKRFECNYNGIIKREDRPVLKTILDKTKPTLDVKNLTSRYEKAQLINLLERSYKDKLIPDHKDKKTVCILAVKKGKLNFVRKQSPELDTNDLRYITGTLTTATNERKKEEIKIFFTHVPGGRVDEKAEMLLAAYCFYIRNQKKYAFLGGDFNSDINIDGNTSLWSTFKRLYEAARDTEETGQKTFVFTDGKEKRLDYALASKSLALKCKCKTEPPIDTLKYGTDHRALRTTIEI